MPGREEAWIYMKNVGINGKIKGRNQTKRIKGGQRRRHMRLLNAPVRTLINMCYYCGNENIFGKTPCYSKLSTY